MTGPHQREPAAWFAALVAGVVLALVYTASAAPDVTFWDAGEFLAAFATFGIPHPPGTPLFVAVGRVWTLAAFPFGVPSALAGNLLSAACTAVAGGCTAWLVARWLRSRAAGIAAAVCAGTMSTVWANATEAEVYAASLALVAVALTAADVTDPEYDEHRHAAFTGTRWTVVAMYALGLAVPLHLSALVAGPAVLWLACAPRVATLADACRRFAWGRGALIAAASLLIGGVGTAHAPPVLVGALGLAGCAAARARAGVPTVGRRTEAIAVAAAVAVALSATSMLVIRARHDPWLNQGDPSNWSRLVDVIGRRQYAVAPLWPRRAPWWLQIANLGEWADWQFALGIAPDVAPTWWRTPITLAFAVVGLIGSTTHRRRDPRSWMALLVLLGAGSVGVVGVLNLKAGPSFGVGILAVTAPHEARERDYFFVLAWWAWGVWAGIGAVTIAQRLALARAPRSVALASALGVIAAASPVALNWRAASRARPASAHVARDYARALLENAPRDAVLIVNGDNDTYPVWHAQAARYIRRDVTVVTASLLPAPWYRAELARRGGLLDARDVAQWSGPAATLTAIAEHATMQRRALTVDLATDDATRHAVAWGPGMWRLRGLTLDWRPPASGFGSATSRSTDVALAPDLAAVVGAPIGDSVAIARAAEAAPGVGAAMVADTTGDGVVAWAYRQLACPAAARADFHMPHPARRDRSLEGACRAR